MLLENPGTKIKEALAEAEEVWVATALMKKAGWKLFASLPEGVKQHYLVGTDLPTHPDVLKELMQKASAGKIAARRFGGEVTYHPKVYIIRKTDKSLVAFVGSSNATLGGFENNVEMNVEVTSRKQCEELIDWFSQYYRNYGVFITETFLKEYRVDYAKISKGYRKVAQTVKQVNENTRLSSEQFFSQNHHEILAKKYWWLNSSEAFLWRKNLKTRLIDLHKRIHASFGKYELNDLHTTLTGYNRTSRHWINPFSGKKIDSIWLHYGKSPKQLEKYSEKSTRSFVNQVRIQVIVQHRTVGIWLMLGKQGGSSWDRKYFAEQMKVESVRNQFYDCFNKLGEGYWMDDGSKRGDYVFPGQLSGPQELIRISQEATEGHYFTIGRDYGWEDAALSDKHIADTVLSEFKKLYPLYLIMRHLH